MYGIEPSENGVPYEPLPAPTTVFPCGAVASSDRTVEVVGKANEDYPMDQGPPLEA